MRWGTDVSRRGVLLGGTAALVAACSGRSAPVGAPAPLTPPAGSSALTQPVTVQRRHSVARGRDVDLVLIAPEGVPASGLPVCLALHGRGANARTFLDLGVPQMLTDLVRGGARPFAVAAVDGDHYWVENGAGDDPQRLLTDEVPGWLQASNLRPVTGVLGISMGGFGALDLARRRRDLTAVATCSAALFRTWSEAKARGVFASEAQWQAAEPLAHLDELPPGTLSVWCGESDPFLAANRRLIDRAGPVTSSITPGGHTDSYWRGVLPDALRFVGERL
ncbi:alpha/beta hydrolase [Amycolatopsis sp. NBC_01480]|uniref:alpha/beta hydrolase n=1 Tax=Amycolatopsis sp. NBC_01480 TaxID=2903562 RepID=UPI002E2B6BB7|nr:alpha/beta hydrolase-fold protein [Amycolatopsis sp. NBC_01480]